MELRHETTICYYGGPADGHVEVLDESLVRPKRQLPWPREHPTERLVYRLEGRKAGGPGTVFCAVFTGERRAERLPGEPNKVIPLGREGRRRRRRA